MKVFIYLSRPLIKYRKWQSIISLMRCDTLSAYSVFIVFALLFNGAQFHSPEKNLPELQLNIKIKIKTKQKRQILHRARKSRTNLKVLVAYSYFVLIIYWSVTIYGRLVLAAKNTKKDNEVKIKHLKTDQNPCSALGRTRGRPGSRKPEKSPWSTISGYPLVSKLFPVV